MGMMLRRNEGYRKLRNIKQAEPKEHVEVVAEPTDEEKQEQERVALFEKAKEMGLKPHHKAKKETLERLIEESEGEK